MISVLLALMSSLLFADFALIYEMDGSSDGIREEIIQYRDAENASKRILKSLLE